jgi:RNA polymerase sigma-70 factor (ECF subfamily)
VLLNRHVTLQEVGVLSYGRVADGRMEWEVATSVSDEEQFRSLFRTHYQAIVRYAARRSAVGTDPDDIVAETFAVAWRRRESLPVARELPWLYGIAARVLANQRRSQRRALRLQERLRLVTRVRFVSVEDEAASRAELGSVAAAFSSLRESDAEVLRLAAWEGLSSSQIAVVLGCSDNAAALRLHRARKRLEEAILKENCEAGHRDTAMPGTGDTEVDADEVG